MSVLNDLIISSIVFTFVAVIISAFYVRKSLNNSQNQCDTEDDEQPILPDKYLQKLKDKRNPKESPKSIEQDRADRRRRYDIKNELEKDAIEQAIDGNYDPIKNLAKLKKEMQSRNSWINNIQENYEAKDESKNKAKEDHDLLNKVINQQIIDCLNKPNPYIMSEVTELMSTKM